MKNNFLFWAILQELTGWLITALFAVALLYPVYQQIEYHFLIENALFIVTAATLLRYFIFYNSIKFLQPNVVKFGMFVGLMVLWVYILNRYEMLLQLYDNFDLTDFGKARKPMSNTAQKGLLEYLYKEILLSGLVALIAIPLFILRLIGAYWRVAKVRFSNMMQD